MYLYFNKEGVLTTIIPHGEPVRQGSSLNLYICFDSDTFSDIEEVKEYVFSVELELPGSKGRGVTHFLPISSYPDKPEVFKKTNDSEITYDLINNRNYWIFHFIFTPAESTVNSGKLIINTAVLKDENIFYQGKAEVFVEKTYGSLKKIINESEEHFNKLEEQFANLLKTLNSNYYTKEEILKLLIDYNIFLIDDVKNVDYNELKESLDKKLIVLENNKTYLVANYYQILDDKIEIFFNFETQEENIVSIAHIYENDSINNSLASYTRYKLDYETNTDKKIILQSSEESKIGADALSLDLKKGGATLYHEDSPIVQYVNNDDKEYFNIKNVSGDDVLSFDYINKNYKIGDSSKYISFGSNNTLKLAIENVNVFEITEIIKESGLYAKTIIRNLKYTSGINIGEETYMFSDSSIRIVPNYPHDVNEINMYGIPHILIGGSAYINRTDNVEYNAFAYVLNKWSKKIVPFAISGVNGKTYYWGKEIACLQDIEDKTATSKGDDTSKLVTLGIAKELVADLVNGAPETLDTLDELAAALKDNASIIDTLENAIANKLSYVTDTDRNISLKSNDIKLKTSGANITLDKSNNVQAYGERVKLGSEGTSVILDNKKNILLDSENKISLTSLAKINLESKYEYVAVLTGEQVQEGEIGLSTYKKIEFDAEGVLKAETDDNGDIIYNDDGTIKYKLSSGDITGKAARRIDFYTYSMGNWGDKNSITSSIKMYDEKIELFANKGIQIKNCNIYHNGSEVIDEQKLNNKISNLASTSYVDNKVSTVENNLSNNYYDRETIDAKLDEIETGGGEVNLNNYYTKSQVDTKLDTKVDKLEQHSITDTFYSRLTASNDAGTKYEVKTGSVAYPKIIGGRTKITRNLLTPEVLANPYNSLNTTVKVIGTGIQVTSTMAKTEESQSVYLSVRYRFDLDDIKRTYGNILRIHSTVINNSTAAQRIMVTVEDSEGTVTSIGNSIGTLNINMTVNVTNRTERYINIIIYSNNNAIADAGSTMSYNNLYFGPSEVAGYEEGFEGFRNGAVTSIRSTGVNIYKPIDTYDVKTSSNGITITNNHDGSYTLNGTTTSSGLVVLDLDYILPAGTYTFYNLNSTEHNLLYRNISCNYGANDYIIVTPGSSVTKTIQTNINQIYLYFSEVGVELNNVVLRPMIVMGENKSLIDYVPYEEDILDIPESITSLDGYGLGINDEYYNYIDLDKKIFVKQVSEYIFTGKEKISTIVTNLGTFNRFSFGLWSIAKQSEEIILDGYVWVRNYNGDFRHAYIEGNNLFVFDEATTTEELLSKLKGKKMIYPLATPTSVDILEELSELTYLVNNEGAEILENEYGIDVPTQIDYNVSINEQVIENSDNITKIKKTLTEILENEIPTMATVYHSLSDIGYHEDGLTEETWKPYKFASEYCTTPLKPGDEIHLTLSAEDVTNYPLLACFLGYTQYVVTEHNLASGWFQEFSMRAASYTTTIIKVLSRTAYGASTDAIQFESIISPDDDDNSDGINTLKMISIDDSFNENHGAMGGYWVLNDTYINLLDLNRYGNLGIVNDLEVMPFEADANHDHFVDKIIYAIPSGYKVTCDLYRLCPNYFYTLATSFGFTDVDGAECSITVWKEPNYYSNSIHIDFDFIDYSTNTHGKIQFIGGPYNLSSTLWRVVAPSEVVLYNGTLEEETTNTDNGFITLENTAILSKFRYLKFYLYDMANGDGSQAIIPAPSDEIPFKYDHVLGYLDSTNTDNRVKISVNGDNNQIHFTKLTVDYGITSELKVKIIGVY